jgi:hypothetical protein
MNSHIDFRTLPNNVPSLCIPRVFTNWTENRIRRIFDDLGMGEIQRIDIVSKTTEKGEKFNRVFVHFKRWFANQNADMARERLLNGKEIKIVYDDPWFWKVSAYREATKKSEHHSDREERPRATIKFDDDRERPRDDRRPPARDRPHHDDRRPPPGDRRRDEDRDRRDRRPRNDNSKEFLDRELEKINPTIPESMRCHTPDPFVHTPEPFSAKIVVKTEQSDVGAGGVVYDMDIVNSTKKRKIVIKKEPVVQKVPLKIEAEEGELSDGSIGMWCDGDGLANVRW